MGDLAAKVSEYVYTIKAWTLVPYYKYMASSNGHLFMRRIGPIISLLFFITQALHAIYFYFVVGPAFIRVYGYNWYTILWNTIGWLLFVKVTYTYWWVST